MIARAELIRLLLDVSCPSPPKDTRSRAQDLAERLESGEPPEPSLPSSPEEWRTWWEGLDEESRSGIVAAARALSAVIAKPMRLTFGIASRMRAMTERDAEIAGAVATLGAVLVGGVPK